MNKIYDKYGFRFREWDIYKDARKLRIEIYDIVKTYPSEEKFALTDQTKRALNSIILNIAEGANRTTNKDLRIYISRAAGSLDEVVSCLDCALDNNYINKKEHQGFLEEAGNLAKRLKGFIVKLSNS
jgi:four helix bundle protein